MAALTIGEIEIEQRAAENGGFANRSVPERGGEKQGENRSFPGVISGVTSSCGDTACEKQPPVVAVDNDMT
jgi:hypothetical protein